MKVSVKDLQVSMEVKNNGIELDISDNNEVHLGDLFVTKKYLIWCSGKTQRENGKKIKWENFIAYMQRLDDED